MSLSTRRNCAWRATSSATSLGWLERAIAGAAMGMAEGFLAPNGSASIGVMGTPTVACGEDTDPTDPLRAAPGCRPPARALPSDGGVHRTPGPDGAAEAARSWRLQRGPHRGVRAGDPLRQRQRLAQGGGGEVRPAAVEPGGYAHPRIHLCEQRAAQGPAARGADGARRDALLRSERAGRERAVRPPREDPWLRGDERGLLRRADRRDAVRGHQARRRALRRGAAGAGGLPRLAHGRSLD